MSTTHQCIDQCRIKIALRTNEHLKIVVIFNADHVIDYQNVVVQYNVFIYMLAHIHRDVRNVDQKCSFECSVSLVSNPLYVLNYDSISKYINSNRIKMIQT